MSERLRILLVIAVLCGSLAGWPTDSTAAELREAPVGASRDIESSATAATFDLNRYLATLNRQCAADSDCEVKDVGNCCGYYSQCVAKNATPQKEAVRAWCERNEVKGICGFQEIQGCACVAGRCTAAAVQ